MPRTRRPARQRLARPPRLVGGGAAVDPARDALNEWEIDGWRIGLLVNAYLAYYFPDFWRAHVAPQPTTTARLLGSVHSFLILGQHDLLALDRSHACVLDLEVPVAEASDLIDGYRDDGGILSTLANDLFWWVADPPVQCYGLDEDAIAAAHPSGDDPLLAALAWLYHETAWAVSEGDDLPHLPTLPYTTNVQALADALAWSIPLDGITQPWRLGDLVRYAAAATGNEYADYSNAEIAADGTWWLRGIYDKPDNLAYEVQRQRGAKALADTYAALSRRCAADPVLIDTIIAEIVLTAQRVAPAPEEMFGCAA